MQRKLSNFTKKHWMRNFFFIKLLEKCQKIPNILYQKEAKELVSHAMIKLGETDLMFSDTFPGQNTQSGDQVTICITSDDIEKSKQIFESLKQEGQVKMPLQETFFSPAYGIVTDKFGVTFQIFTEGKQ
jgi:PhnB protein